jgi:hypothetical protein
MVACSMGLGLQGFWGFVVLGSLVRKLRWHYLVRVG